MPNLNSKLLTKSTNLQFVGDSLVSDFYIDKNKTKIDIRSEESALKSITPIFMMILARLKLPFLVKLEVHFVNNVASNAKTYVNAGFYNGQWGNRTITINLDRSYTLENILAILCHETTHYFMQYHNLNCSDVKENELKTDTTACLIGFSKILKEGYQVVETITPQFGYMQTRRTKLGYLGDDQCNDLVEYLKFKRQEILRDKNINNEVNDIKNKIKQLIVNINYFETQLENNNPSNNKENYKINNSSENSELQSALLRKENINSKSIVSNIKNDLKNSDDLNALKNDLNQVEKLYKDLQEVYRIYDKYHI